jgi:hypothetical protein
MLITHFEHTVKSHYISILEIIKHWLISMIVCLQREWNGHAADRSCLKRNIYIYLFIQLLAWRWTHVPTPFWTVPPPPLAAAACSTQYNVFIWRTIASCANQFVYLRDRSVIMLPAIKCCMRVAAKAWFLGVTRSAETFSKSSLLLFSICGEFYVIFSYSQQGGTKNIILMST